MPSPMQVESLGHIDPSAHTLRDTTVGQQLLIATGRKTPEQVQARAQRPRTAGPWHRASRPRNGSFLAWDGEGITEGNRHRYILLCNSLGQTLYRPNGIRTSDAIAFLCNIAESHSFTNHVMYGGSYDANMILSDLSYLQIKSLVEHGHLWLGGIRKGRRCRYRLEYRPRKYFRISRYMNDKREVTITIWDVIGFFQSTFVKAVQAWLPDTDLEMIARMKQQRSSFKLSKAQEITDYCIQECELLAKLMQTLREQCRKVGIVPTRWDGAGALSAKMLQKNKVKLYMDKEVPNEVATAAEYAYFGGRIELVQYGSREKPTFAHDVVSAYPFAATLCPCLQHGRWRKANNPRPHQIERMSPFTLLHLEYQAYSINTRFHPFPWRAADGAISFPPTTEGWYWKPEYVAGMDSALGEINVTEAYEWRQECDHQPFAFIPTIFRARQRLKIQGHGGEKVYKLGLNATYGKLAQQVGGRDGPPAYHQIEWAGFITSLTRARLFSLAMLFPDNVIAFETDGLYSTRKHCNNGDNSLGSFDVTEYDGITYVQSGLYWILESGEWKPKYRGLDPNTLERKSVLSGWTQGAANIHASSTRFRGMATSVITPERFTEWRQWITETKEIRLAPMGKRIAAIPGGLHGTATEQTSPGDALIPTYATGGGSVSKKHPIKWKGEPSIKTIDDPYYLADMELDESAEERLA